MVLGFTMLYTLASIYECVVYIYRYLYGTQTHRNVEKSETQMLNMIQSIERAEKPLFEVIMKINLSKYKIV